MQDFFNEDQQQLDGSNNYNVFNESLSEQPDTQFDGSKHSDDDDEAFMESLRQNIDNNNHIPEASDPLSKKLDDLATNETD